MARRHYRIVILEQYCKGCGLCIEFCKEGKLYIRQMPNKQGIQTAAVHDAVDCTGCLQCATICPDAAVEVTEVGVPAGKGARDGTDR
jgi:2-oxoglutarate ferredoxin oxidoreductase subunit delta